ncbi:MAG: CheB methylesterase domain-containing protein [Thiovulaceae bacterium]|nr:CheB methylesterase domain-containing protein [Sulfurimonadaceae bacterium]
MQKIILIGSSTGGPGHLQKIVSSLPSSFNAIIVIAQHMGFEYLQSFASRLNEISALSVNLAHNTTWLENTNIYICEKNCEFELADDRVKLLTQEGHNQSLYNPDINQLFSSATKLCGKYEIMAIILTGIGDDGATAMLKLSKCNATLIAESKESAIIYGMPMRAKELVKDIDVLSLNKIIHTIQEFGK